MNAILLAIWFIAAAIILFIFLPKYLKSRKSIYALAVYCALGSILLIYALAFSKFYEIEASLIFDDQIINNMSKDSAVSQFWMFVVLGVILIIPTIVFIAFHVRSHRKFKSRKSLNPSQHNPN